MNKSKIYVNEQHFSISKKYSPSVQIKKLKSCAPHWDLP